MITGGILEDMFSGYGLEYLYFKPYTNYAVGFELFEVTKRDYKWKFGTLNYKNTTGSLNFYYRNYGRIPFDLKLSHGEYLAGDFGTTMSYQGRLPTVLNSEFLQLLQMSLLNNSERAVLTKEYFLMCQFTEMLLTIHGGH